MKHLSFLLIIMTLISCKSVVVNGGAVKKRYTNYQVALLPTTWQAKKMAGADLFFQKEDSDAMIYLNAQCEKISDSPLEVLTAQALSGTGKYSIITELRVMLSGREALISEVNVTLDGVDRYVKIMVLRKNRCIFDAVLSSKTYTADAVKDFDAMISSFSAEADL